MMLRKTSNWLLVEKGVCVMFGPAFCAYIPNKTAPDGSFTKAMERLRALEQTCILGTGLIHFLGLVDNG